MWKLYAQWMVSPADICCSVSVGRGFRMNWHCLFTCSCSTCSALCLSAAGAAVSLPPWDIVHLTWLIWMLNGNSWPETQRRKQDQSLEAWDSSHRRKTTAPKQQRTQVSPRCQELTVRVNGTSVFKRHISPPVVMMRNRITDCLGNNKFRTGCVVSVLLTYQRIGSVVPLGDDPQLIVFHVPLSRRHRVRDTRHEMLPDLRGQDGREMKEEYSPSVFTCCWFTSHVNCAVNLVQD